MKKLILIISLSFIVMTSFGQKTISTSEGLSLKGQEFNAFTWISYCCKRNPNRDECSCYNDEHYVCAPYCSTLFIFYSFPDIIKSRRTETNKICILDYPYMGDNSPWEVDWVDISPLTITNVYCEIHNGHYVCEPNVKYTRMMFEFPDLFISKRNHSILFNQPLFLTNRRNS
jgi:hypothetical protein